MKQPVPVRVHIDELVLHGFAPSDRDTVVESVQTELARLLSERGLPPVITERDVVDGGSFPIRRADVGLQIAQALYEALGNG